MKISEIKNMTILYDVLNTSYFELNSLVNDNKDKLYSRVNIPKRNGSQRKIFIPNENLLKLQRRLKIILDDSYNPHRNATGFIKNKNIVDNASIHVNKKYILNMDLENFFETITAGRVFAMFEKYFKITNKDVCFFLTRICCHPDGFLPQGAPTSPTISNIISKQLDKQITKYVNKAGNTIHYSRYADDITFSSNYNFESGLLEIDDNNYKIGKKIKNIINESGFNINNDKTRYQTHNQHQEVTGIVVNEKLNVNRKYIRNIRAMIHSVKMDCGQLDKPVKKFNKINNRNVDINGLFKVIRGKIEYVGMVKGYHDKVFENIANKFNETYNLVNEMLEINGEEKLKSVSIINIYSPHFTYLVPDGDVYFNPEGSMAYGLGSAFLLKNYGIVSNYHVFKELLDFFENSKGIVEKSRIRKPDIGYINNVEYPIKLLSVDNKKQKIIHTKIVKYDENYDLILLEPKNINFKEYGYNLASLPMEIDNPIKLLGFPNFKTGDAVREIDGKIININKSEEKFEINRSILAGNSGGPILNSNKEVIGVASEGRGNHVDVGRTLDWLTY